MTHADQQNQHPTARAHAEHNERLERSDGRRDERFQRAHRLRASADFARTRQQGRRLNSAHLTLIYTQRPPNASPTTPPNDTSASSAQRMTASPTRIGFSISKRVGDAVRRNLVKRRLREHIRRALWKIAPGWDMIIGARAGAAQADSATLGAETRDLLLRARLLVAAQHEES